MSQRVCINSTWKDYALKRATEQCLRFYSDTSDGEASAVPSLAADMLLSCIIANKPDLLHAKGEEILRCFLDDVLRTHSNVRVKLMEFMFEVHFRLRDFDRAFVINLEKPWKDVMMQFALSASEEQLFIIVTQYIEAFRKYLDDRSMPSARVMVNQAMAYVNTHFTQDITLSETAERMCISSFYLSRMFKQTTGKGFSGYLAMLRIQKAKELLRDSDMPIRRVAAVVGYPNHAYFGKIFRVNTKSAVVKTD